MASQDVWVDFETLRYNLRYYKVDHLKQIVAGFNEECGSNLTKSGKKMDLIDRIHREMTDWRTNNNIDKWLKGRTIMSRVRSTGSYLPSANGEPSTAGDPRGYGQHVPPHVLYRSGQVQPRYAQNPPSRQVADYGGSTALRAPGEQPAPPMPTIRFKFSPFFKIDKIVSSVIQCPESTTSMDRRSQSLSFVMTSELNAKLNSASPKYQLRLYCTSSTYYTPPGTTFVSSVTPCPIEFPPTCEVRVNGTQLNANLKGLKKKPGTAPPPDLGKVVRTAQGNSNRIEMIYVNSQQPTPPKKYYLVVMLVEVTSVDQLIDRLRKGKYRSKNDVLTEMNKSLSDDDDIVAGHQKMSLKCPLSYMRITTPCRAKTCPHPQCFDAMSWYSVMEQTTTWMCPVCEKVLNVDDLYIDGYFDDILKHTPEDVEDVIVEADGQWHSEDNKYGSPQWLVAHPSAPPPKPSPTKRAPSPIKHATNGVDGKDKARIATPIEISDSEDEDEGRVKRELSPSTDGLVPHASQSSRTSLPTRSHAPDIIDLTLSDDDEPPPPPRASTSAAPQKRKQTDELLSPTEQIWKKSRTDSGLSPSTAAFNDLVNNSTLRMVEDAAAGRRFAPLPSSASPRYATSSQPPPYRSSGPGPYGSPPTLNLPPPPAPLPPRRPPSSSHDNYRNPMPAYSPYAQRGSGAGGSSPQNWR